MPGGGQTLDTSARLPARMGVLSGSPQPLDGTSQGETPPAPPRVKLYTWTCQYCGQTFTSRSYNARYCSPTHKTYAARERRAKLYTP
ncbi:MAG: hypothetical protein HXY42_12135 [Chloroflexi bacterium]|nr:hypothetical protein [Chloroflexota bacterium]